MSRERAESVNSTFSNIANRYELPVEYKYKYPIKYDYVLSFITNASQEDINAVFEKTMNINTNSESARVRAKNRAKQIIHKSSAVNGLEHPSFKGLPSEFYERLQRFVTSDRNSRELRQSMIDILRKYEDFKDKYGKESMFINILYRILPHEFLTLDLEGGMRGGGTAVKTSEGHSFVVNSTRKNWTANKKYKKWVTKLTRKQRPNKKSEDLCVGSGSICKGDLGIPRKYMPQFNSPAEIKSFTRFVKRVYKIKSFKATRKARQLKPSQGEINKKRIQGLIDEGVLDKVNIPLVVSGDNYVVDGHHRWAAYRLKKAEASLPVMVIDAPVKDVLGIAVAWGAKHQEF